MDYVKAIDHLLGFVGREVLIRVSGIAHHPGFLMLHATLYQGERLNDRETVFPLSDKSSDGLYIDRAAFTGGSYDVDAERLTIWLGPVAISIEPHVPGFDTSGGHEG